MTWNKPQEPEAREVMDIRQAARYLGISPDTLYKYASTGVVPAFKLGNRWRFKRSRLDQWMDEIAQENVRNTDGTKLALIGDRIDRERKSNGGKTYARETKD